GPPVPPPPPAAEIVMSSIFSVIVTLDPATSFRAVTLEPGLRTLAPVAPEFAATVVSPPPVPPPPPPPVEEITPPLIDIPVPAVNAAWARLVVKYRFVVPSLI